MNRKINRAGEQEKSDSEDSEVNLVTLFSSEVSLLMRALYNQGQQGTRPFLMIPGYNETLCISASANCSSDGDCLNEDCPGKFSHCHHYHCQQFHCLSTTINVPKSMSMSRCKVVVRDDYAHKNG